MSDSNADLEIWNAIADHWDKQVGEGSDFQKHLVIPATDRLLDVRPGQRVLDCCCGNGNYARKLFAATGSAPGAEVVAFDGSSRMIELCREKPGSELIEYHVADATDEAAILEVAAGRVFDRVVCTMAMMDLPTIEPLLRAVRAVIRPHAPFVFSIGHPSFHTNEAQMLAVQDHGQGDANQDFSVIVKRYLTAWPHWSRGLLDQPRAHMLYHRSLSDILRTCFLCGFVIDGLEEPAFDPDTRLRSPFSWARRPEIPPVMVVRLRLA